VNDRRSARLLFVDKRTGKVVARVRVPGGAFLTPDPYRAGRLWLTVPAGNRVVQVDIQRARLVGRPIRVSREPTLLTPTRDSVVVASRPEKGTLLRSFDKATGRQVGATVRDKGTPTDLDTAGGVVATNWIQPAVLRLDDRLGEPRWTELKLPPGKGLFGSMANEMAVGRGDVGWVLLNDSTPNTFALVRVDLRTGKQLGRMLPLGAGIARDLAIDRGTVWVANLKAGTVVRVDERSGQVVGKPIRIGAVQGNVAAADGQTWVARVHDLIRITP
jgi:hypothetical protein